jgi:hypothetical protein
MPAAEGPFVSLVPFVVNLSSAIAKEFSHFVPAYDIAGADSETIPPVVGTQKPQSGISSYIRALRRELDASEKCFT